MTRKKIILFVPSYPNLPSMLYFIEKYGLNSEINIYTNVKNLYKFIEYLNNIFWNNKIKLFYINISQYYKIKIKNKNIVLKIINFIKYLWFINKMKLKLYDKYFKDKRDCNVYIFCCVQDIFNIYFLRRLSDNNSICLMDIVPSEEKGRKILFREYTLRQLIRSLIYKIIFSKHIVLFTNGRSVLSHMSKVYIKKYVDYELEYDQYAKDVDKNYNNYLRELSLDYAKYKMIFFDQSFGDNILIQNEKGIFRRKLKKIFIKYFGEKFAIKYHPDVPKSQNMLNFNDIKSENILEQFIPGEYFYNKNTKYYISYSSNTITDEQNYTRPNNIRISLLYLLPFKEEYIRENLFNIFKSKIKGKVLFPKSFTELENIFKDEMR